jgi:hypothetical protein
MGTDEHGEFAFCMGDRGYSCLSLDDVEPAMPEKPLKVEIFSFFANNRGGGGAE